MTQESILAFNCSVSLLFLVGSQFKKLRAVWNNQDYIHQIDINDTWTDSQIWDYAKERGLTISKKDADFTNKDLIFEPPPKVIHIKIGNFKLKEFHVLLTKIWDDVVKMSEENRLVTIYSDRIEGIKSNS